MKPYQLGFSQPIDSLTKIWFGYEFQSFVWILEWDTLTTIGNNLGKFIIMELETIRKYTTSADWICIYLDLSEGIIGTIVFECQNHSLT